MTLVSVIVPCYNHSGFLTSAVESVLAQTHRELEVWIVDDASTDDTAGVAKRLEQQDSRVRVLTHSRNQGLSASRNHAIERARGEWIGFCDADDVWLPQKLDIQLASARMTPEADIIYSDSYIIDGQGCRTGRRFSDLFPLPSRPSGDLSQTLYLRNFINVQTAIVRRFCLPSPAFDPEVALVNDWLLWTRLSRSCSFLYLPNALACYRIHEGSTNTTAARRYEVHRFKVYKRTLKAASQLERSMLSPLWYHMGVCLLKAGWRRRARGCFYIALRMSSPMVRRPLHSARSLARLITA